MFCKNCGTQLNDDAKFCGNCGTPVQAASAPVVTPQPVADPAPVVAPQPVAEPAPVAVAPAPAAPKKEKKKSKAWLWITIIVVVLLAVAGVAAYLLLLSPSAKFNKVMKKAETCIADANYEEAITHYESALEIKESEEAEEGLVDAYVMLAEKQFSDGNFENALTTYQTILEKDKKNKDAKKGIVSCKYELALSKFVNGEYDNAIELYDYVLNETDDTDTRNKANIGKADCLLAKGKESLTNSDYNTALEYFGQVAQIANDSQLEESNNLTRECYISMGYEALALGDTSNAEYYFRTVYDWDYYCVDAYLGLAQVYADLGDIDNALSWLDAGLYSITDEEDIAKLDKKLQFYKDNIIISGMTTYYYDAQSSYDTYYVEETYDALGNTTSSVSYNYYNNKLREALYNENGLITEERQFDEYGYLNRRYCYEYDANGNQIAYSGYDSGENLLFKYEYTFDDKNNITQSMEYNEFGELVYSQEWNYSETGELIRNAYYTYELGEFASLNEYLYEYDEQGNQTLFQYVENNGTENVYFSETVTVYEYDDKNNVTKATSTETIKNYDVLVSEITNEMIYQYDEDGNITYKCYSNTDAEEILYEVTSNYENGRLTSEFCKDVENLDYVIYYTYDSEGNVLSEFWNYGEYDEELGEYVYTYNRSAYYYEGTGILSSYIEDDLSEENNDYICSYNESGFVTKEETNDYCFETEYDEYNNATMRRYTYYEDGTIYEYYYRYTYDEFGNMIERYNETDWVTEEQHTYQYQFSDAVKTGYEVNL